jgi:hypothetical protein
VPDYYKMRRAEFLAGFQRELPQATGSAWQGPGDWTRINQMVEKNFTGWESIPLRC